MKSAPTKANPLFLKGKGLNIWKALPSKIASNKKEKKEINPNHPFVDTSFLNRKHTTKFR